MTVEPTDRMSAQVTLAKARAALITAVEMLRSASEQPIAIDALREDLVEIGGLLPLVADCMYSFIKDLPLAASDEAMPIHPFSTHREIHAEAVSRAIAAYSAAESAAQCLSGAAASLSFATGTFVGGGRIWPEQSAGAALGLPS